MDARMAKKPRVAPLQQHGEHGPAQEPTPNQGGAGAGPHTGAAAMVTVEGREGAVSVGRRRGLAQDPPRPKVAMLPNPEPRRLARAPTPPAPDTAGPTAPAVSLTHGQRDRPAAPTVQQLGRLLPPQGALSLPTQPPACTGPAPLSRPLGQAHPQPAYAAPPPRKPRPAPRRPPPPSPPCEALEEGEVLQQPYPQQPSAVGPPQATGATARLHLAALSGLLWHPECQQLQQQHQQQLQGQQDSTAAERLASGAQASTSAPIAAPTQPPPQGRQQQLQQQQVPDNFGDVRHYVSVFEPLLHEEARGALVNAFEEALTFKKGWQVKVEDVEQRGGGWFHANVLPMPGRQGLRGRHAELVRKDSVMVLTKSAPAAEGPRYGGRGSQLRIACMVRRSGPRQEDPLVVAFHPSCPHHEANDRGSPCMRALHELLDHPFGWLLVPAGSFVTSEREVETLGRVGQGAKGPMRDLLPMLLNPSSMAAQCDGQIAEEWPADFGDPGLMDGFFRWLATAYDMPQREAIVQASSHLCPPQQLANSPVPVLPFTLIQGPPGTGKTHTVKGILNAWHVVGYRRYHESWRREAAKQLAIIQASRSWDRRQLALEALDMLQPDVPKPRVLVCAPSNAATDELCERILKEGFRDLTTQFTFPDVARVGSEDAAMAESVKEVWTERRVQWHLHCDVEEYRVRFFQAEARKQEAEAALEQLLSRLDTAVAASKVPGTEDALLHLAGQMVDLQAARARAMLDHHRLNIVAPRFLPNARFSERQAREELELSLMEHAELVFTTLSSTGRSLFGRIKRRHFDAVLIDEACQAAEVATLQPLVHGTKKVVMVGDPKQLPATLFSRSARDVLLERSLFERMAQSGVAVKLLAVQYRMHPEIRAFPSKFFYDNALEDAPQVVNQPPALFYKHDILKPYVVFDVQHGAETSGQAGRSKINMAEARLAAGLYWELRCETMDAWAAHQADPAGVPEPPRIDVGIVTPYRSQRDLLRTVFESLLGPEAAAEARIETVDSFQGKQLDVIILSCVRASPSGMQGSIGFLADTRRMNVAITRAKQALWVLGHAASLRQHHVWHELLQDAQDRGCMVEEANGDDPALLPRFAELLRRKAAAADAAANPLDPLPDLPAGPAAHATAGAPAPQLQIAPPTVLRSQPPLIVLQAQPQQQKQQQPVQQQASEQPTPHQQRHIPVPAQPQHQPPSGSLHLNTQQYPLLHRQLQLLQQQQQQQQQGSSALHPQPPTSYVSMPSSNDVQQSLGLLLPSCSGQHQQHQ